MAATKRNAMLIEEARGKIQTTQLINRLQNHALGDLEMSPTQVRAVEILLRKKIPDLSAVQAEVTHLARNARELSDDELAGHLTSDSGNGVVAPPLDPSQLN